MRWMRVNGVWRDERFNVPMETAPIQVRGEGEVPLDVAVEAYKEYAAQYGTSQSLARLNERGGFGAAELAILLYERCKRLERGTGPTPERTT